MRHTTSRLSVLVLAAALASAPGVGAAFAQSPFDSLRRAAEAEAKRRAEEALRRAVPTPAPATPGTPAPSTPPPAVPGQTTSAQTGASPAMTAPPNAAYKISQDGKVLLENAPYPKNARYGDFPTPPLMRMPAPIVMNAPGQVQAPVWSAGRASFANGRTAADEKEFPPEGECRWFSAMSSAGMAAPSDLSRQGISSAEGNALRADIQPMYDWLARQPNVAKPQGVCALFTNYGLYATPSTPGMIDAGYALRGNVMIGFWPGAQMKRRGDRVVTEGEITHLDVTFNGLPNGGRSRMSIEDTQGTMFEEVPVTHTIQGFPVYNNSDLVIALNDRPLTRPARMDRLLRWQIAEIDKNLATARSQAARRAEQLAQKESPAQKAENEKIIAMRARASYGGDMAKARASFESEVGDELTKLRAEADVTNPANPVYLLTQMKAASEQRLKAMSPQEASAPACLSSQVRGTVVSDVLGVNDPHCVHRMEEANPDYYDRSLPRSKVQLVTVSRFDFRRAADSRDDAAAYNLVFGVDWQAFRRDVMKR